VTDAELDARFASLPAQPPSAELCVRTLALVAAERETERLAAAIAPRAAERSRTRRWVATLTGLGAVAAALAAWPGAPEVADPAELVPKGAPAAPAVDLRAAVRRGGSVERYTPGARYAAGDTVYFRVHTSSPTTARLTRDGVEIWAGPLAGGEVDLPVGYALEPGEAAATFAIDTADGARAELRIEAVAR